MTPTPDRRRQAEQDAADREADRRLREQMAADRIGLSARIDEALETARTRGLRIRVEVIGRDAYPDA